MMQRAIMHEHVFLHEQRQEYTAYRTEHTADASYRADSPFGEHVRYCREDIRAPGLVCSSSEANDHYSQPHVQYCPNIWRKHDRHTLRKSIDQAWMFFLP